LGLLYAEVARFRDATGAACGALHLRARGGAGAAATAESLFQEDYHVEGWSSDVLTMPRPYDYLCNVKETHACAVAQHFVGITSCMSTINKIIQIL
jgi:hypothetical protein